MVGETVSGMARCPYDPKHANVALFAGESPHFTCFPHYQKKYVCCPPLHITGLNIDIGNADVLVVIL